jgi:hypothetical protein
MPVGRTIGSKSPFDGFKCDAGLYIRVFINVIGVIISNEPETVYLIKNGKGN